MQREIRNSRRAFTLVEIMIVAAVIALLAAIALPGFMRSRKRAQAGRVLDDLRLIDGAVSQYALETNKTTGATVATVDWTHYMKPGSRLYKRARDIFNHAYGPQQVDQLPAIPTLTKDVLSDVVDTDFWSPYQ